MPDPGAAAPDTEKEAVEGASFWSCGLEESGEISCNIVRMSPAFGVSP